MRFNLLQLLTRKCNNEAEGRVIKGGGEGATTKSINTQRGEWQLPGTFFGMKK